MNKQGQKAIVETVANGETVQTIVESNPMQGLASQLAKTLSLNPSEYYEEIKGEDGSITEVSKKTYNFVNPIGKRSTMTVYDHDIIEAMEVIDKAMKGKTLLTFAICKKFQFVAESGKLENMGFKNVAEFGKAVFGLETSTVNHYVRIAKNFINDDCTVKAGLPNLSVSHFIELNSYVEDGNIAPIIELYSKGELVDGMTTKKVRETLKSLSGNALPDKSEKKEEKKEETSNTGESVPNESEVENLKANFDSQVVVGKILSACNVIEELFNLLNEHEISVIGYTDNLDSIKALAKTLI